MPTILRVSRWWVAAVLLLLAAAGFLHLDADFPNHSRWADDAAKFTDEGWWASGAIHHVLTGQWLVAGDYNPVLAVPLWPVLMEALFHFTGIGVEVARGAAFAFTIGTVVVTGALMARDHPRLAPALMLLVGTSPVLYFFSRLAILEPALIFFLMAAALAAYGSRPPGMARGVLCGALFSLAMLTKTSAIFAAPAIYFLLWFPYRGLWATERGRLVRGLTVPAATFTVCYGLYWVLVVRTHPVDLHVFYAETGATLGLRSVEKAVRIVYRSVTWVDSIAFPMAVLAVAMSLRSLRGLWQDPLFGFAVLLFCGYSGFMVLHNDAEPHYFAVLAVPVMMLALLFAKALARQAPGAGLAVGSVLLLTVGINTAAIAWMLLHPQYSLRNACAAIERAIEADPAATRLVVGHGAIETTLFTHTAALDDLGSLKLEQKLSLYHPGWVLSWNDSLGPFEQPAVASRYRFVEVGSWPALDNADRRALVLYRIEPRQ